MKANVDTRVELFKRSKIHLTRFKLMQKKQKKNREARASVSEKERRKKRE